jgi:hypothetical protein
VIPFTTFTIVYLVLAVIVFSLLRRQFLETQPQWIKKPETKRASIGHA